MPRDLFTPVHRFNDGGPIRTYRLGTSDIMLTSWRHRRCWQITTVCFDGEVADWARDNGLLTRTFKSRTDALRAARVVHALRPMPSAPSSPAGLIKNPDKTYTYRGWTISRTGPSSLWRAIDPAGMLTAAQTLPKVCFRIDAEERSAA